MDIQKVWHDALEEIQERVSRPSFETWFKPTKAVSFEENVFVFAVPHAFAADWVKSRYGNMIEEVLRNVTGNNEIKFNVVVSPEDEDSEEEEKPVYVETSKGEKKMKFELRVQLVGDHASVWMKKEEELDFVPAPHWSFKYGDVEMDVHYLIYDGVEKKKIVLFDPLDFEVKQTLEGFGWEEFPQEYYKPKSKGYIIID